MLAGKLPRTRLFWMGAGVLLVVLAIGAGIAFKLNGSAQPTPAPFSDFLTDVAAGNIERSSSTPTRRRLNGATANGLRASRRRDMSPRTRHFCPGSPSAASASTSTACEPSRVGSLSALGIGLIFFGVAGLVLFRVVTGRVPTLEKARTIDPEAVTVTFKDVAGVDEAKDEVQEIVDFLKEPARFASIGGRIPRGILLVGPPGTGKTLLARSMAGEAGVPFISASGSDFVEMYAGVGASRVRKLFKEARRHKSCIIFIDELDAVGRSRGGNSLSHEEREQTLNQLLVEMDGFAQSESIIVVAATNRAGHSRLGAAASRPVRPSGDRRQPGYQGARADPARALPQGRAGAGRRSALDCPRHAGLLRRGPRQPGQRGGADRRSRRAA